MGWKTACCCGRWAIPFISCRPTASRPTRLTGWSTPPRQELPRRRVHDCVLMTDPHIGIELLQCLSEVRIAGAIQVLAAVALTVHRQAGLLAIRDVAAGIAHAVA